MRSLLRLDADRAVVPAGVVAPASALVDLDAGAIVAVALPAALGDIPEARVERVEGTLVPGFVDLQVNGAAGHDFRHTDPAGAARALRAILRTGVTSVCPTLPTEEADLYLDSMAAITAAAASVTATGDGPRVIGLHLEGPFLSPDQRGAHRAAWLQAPSTALADSLLASPGLPIAVWTLAPELDGALDLVRHLAAQGVVVSAGHTAASDATLDAAVGAGLSMVTHLANAMPPFHHRRPGPVGWALSHPSVSAGLVLDGHHVDVGALRLFRRLLGDRAFGVTDALAVLGLPPGPHTLDGETLDTTTGVARLGGPTGTIAGATVGMDAMAAALFSPAEIGDLVRLCCTSPADAVGRPDLGRLAPGARADVLLLGPDLRLRRLWLGGQPVPLL